MITIGINPKEITIEIIDKPAKEVVVYPRRVFVKVTHIPTGMAVTKVARSQKKAKEDCIYDLFWLLEEYNE